MTRLPSTSSKAVSAVIRGDRSALAPRPAEPFQGLDRAGMPSDLIAAETSALRRLSPTRNRWPDVAAFDERVGELGQRQAAITAQLRDLETQHEAAPAADAERLGAWQLDGRGPRPEPQVDAIAAKIETLRSDYEGLTAAVATVLVDKAAFVEKHRARLMRDADRATDAAHQRLLALIDEVAEAREELVELRSTAMWAALFPHEEAGRTPPAASLAGGLREPLRALGVDTQLVVDRVWRALKADADWLATAATPAQRALIATGESRKTTEAVWAGPPEAVQQDRQEKKAALKRYTDDWGRPPA